MPGVIFKTTFTISDIVWVLIGKSLDCQARVLTLG